MAIISTRIHGLLDLGGGALLLSGRGPLTSSDPRGSAILRVGGAGMLAATALTDHELGVRRIIPMPLHLLGDAAFGALLVSSPRTLRRRGSIGPWLPHMILGASAIAGAILTERGKRGGASSAGDPLPGAPRHTSTTGPAARVAPGETGVQIAPAPVETPGPSVPAPASPESDPERAERADALMRPDSESPAERRSDAELVAQEEAAAAAEAAAIGGQVPHDAEDPAMDPVLQAGGGEQEGWEAAERDLIENATHGDGHGNPLRDAPGGELESDRATAVYGETDGQQDR